MFLYMMIEHFDIAATRWCCFIALFMHILFTNPFIYLADFQRHHQDRYKWRGNAVSMCARTKWNWNVLDLWVYYSTDTHTERGRDTMHVHTHYSCSIITPHRSDGVNSHCASILLYYFGSFEQRNHMELPILFQNRTQNHPLRNVSTFQLVRWFMRNAVLPF